MRDGAGSPLTESENHSIIIETRHGESSQFYQYLYTLFVCQMIDSDRSFIRSKTEIMSQN